jgi:hypothetical protein
VAEDTPSIEALTRDCHTTRAGNALLDIYAIEVSTCCGLAFEAHDETVTDHLVQSERMWNAQLHDLVDNIERQVAERAVRQEAADTSGHGPCDYNGGPGSDQCPHGVFQVCALTIRDWLDSLEGDDA